MSQLTRAELMDATQGSAFMFISEGGTPIFIGKYIPPGPQPATYGVYTTHDRSEAEQWRHEQRRANFSCI